MTAPMIRPALLALLATAAVTAPAADRREVREVSGFTRVAVSAPVEATVTLGERDSVVLEGPERDLAELEALVKDGTLRIRVRDGRNPPWRFETRARIQARRIDGLALAGSGSINAPDLRGEALKLDIAGSGDITVGGKVDTLASNIAGSGKVRAQKLEARRVTVAVAGSGDTHVWAREALKVSITGSGDVRYVGDPAITKAVVGSGTVKRAGDSS